MLSLLHQSACIASTSDMPKACSAHNKQPAHNRQPRASTQHYIATRRQVKKGEAVKHEAWLASNQGSTKAYAGLQGIFVNEEGMVAEGPNMNLGIITHDNELVVSLLGMPLIESLPFIPQTTATCHSITPWRRGSMAGSQASSTVLWPMLCLHAG